MKNTHFHTSIQNTVKKTGHIIKHIKRNKFSKGGLTVFVSRRSEEDDSF